MRDKYNMTLEENVSYAKRNLIDSIYKEANLEGISATFPETKEIFEGRVVSGLSVDETLAINNLKHAWGFILDNLDAPIDLSFVRQVNGIVGAGIVTAAGELRLADVSIGGTTWKPELPDYDRAKSKIADISEAYSGTERALNLFVELCRDQLFYDGNKRTAQLVANACLIQEGCGILAVPVDHLPEWEKLLIEYYESNDPAALKKFLYETSIDGTTYPKPERRPSKSVPGPDKSFKKPSPAMDARDAADQAAFQAMGQSTQNRKPLR